MKKKLYDQRDYVEVLTVSPISYIIAVYCVLEI
jgi:hypothetical protein